MPALLYLESHGNGLELCQALLYNVIGHPQVTAYLSAQVAVGFQGRQTGRRHEYGLAVGKELHLLLALLFHGLEILLMGRTKSRKDTYSGLYNTLQGFHLTGLGYGCLEDAYLAFLPQAPYGQGNAYLRVVAAWRTCNGHIGRQHLVEPFLDGGLAVAACNTYDGYVVFLALALGKSLQCNQAVLDLQEGTLACTGGYFWNVFDYKGPDAAAVQILYVSVAVAARGADGEEQCAFGETQTAAVGQQPVDVDVCLADLTGSDKGCYCRYSHNLFQIISLAWGEGCRPSGA